MMQPSIRTPNVLSPERAAGDIADDFHTKWQSYARRRMLALAAVALWPPACLGLFALSRLWLHMPVVSLSLMLLWLAAALGLVWWQGEFRCPRCSRRYAALGHRRGATNWSRGIFDKVCANCKLRKFERSGSGIGPVNDPTH